MNKDFTSIDSVLKKAANGHNKLCPRVVLGVRIGLTGGEALGLELPREDKQLLSIVETDGCFVSGIEAATGCMVNHRTLRVVDYGKVGATFINVKTNKAVRIAPRKGIRQRALAYAPEEQKRYYAMLIGYQRMPIDELLTIENVYLTTPIKEIISRAGVRVNCDNCEEEIINEREIMIAGKTLCLSCAEPGYYQNIKTDSYFTDLFMTKKIFAEKQD